MDCNRMPCYRVLQEMTNQYLVENRDFIVEVIDDEISYNTMLYHKHLFLLIAMLSKKHESCNWWDNKMLMRDHHAYMSSRVGRCCTTISDASVESDSDVSLS